MWSEKKRKSATKSISLLGRRKSSEAELRAWYLDEDYVPLLLGLTSTRLRLFYCGQRRTYHCKCTHQGQRNLLDRKEQLNFFDGFWELHLLHFFVGKSFRGILRTISRWSPLGLQSYWNPLEKLSRPFLLASKRFRAENAGGIFWPGMFGTRKQMLQEWWNEGVDNSAQKVLHMDDLLMMADPAYAQNRTIKWMILGEEVWCLCWEVAQSKIWSPAPMYQKV